VISGGDEMVTEESKCINCGKELNPRQKWCGGKYCSRRCYTDTRWGKPIRFGKILTRSKAFIEAAKLCQSGLTQAQAARLMGICPHTVSDWFQHYGVEKIFSDRVCEYCGKSLAGMKPLSNRKYCSKSCGRKAIYYKNHPDSGRMKFDPEVRAKALELYWGGLEGTAIAKHLSIAEGTVYSWIHDFGHLRKRERIPEIMALRPIKERLKEANSQEEWNRILREGAVDGETSLIHLVCGTFEGKGEINHLASIVSDILKQDPRNGETYAFCSILYNQISTICWQLGAFRYTKLPKKRGEYFWPERTVGLQIEVRKNEFEYLLSLQKNNSRSVDIT